MDKSDIPNLHIGDRVWLCPDYDKREVKTRVAAVVEKIIASSGRVRVRYREFKCNLSKTVDLRRLLPRTEACLELGEKVDNLKQQA